jgi:outer membrane protein TolC
MWRDPIGEKRLERPNRLLNLVGRFSFGTHMRLLLAGLANKSRLPRARGLVVFALLGSHVFFGVSAQPFPLPRTEAPYSRGLPDEYRNAREESPQSLARAAAQSADLGLLAPDSGALELDPTRLLQLVIERNAQILMARMQARASGLIAEGERAVYDPILFSTVRRESRSRQRTADEVLATLSSPVQTDLLDEDVNSLESGLRQRASSGAELSMSVRMSRRRSNLAPQSLTTPEEKGSLVVGIRQPLMKGRGRQVVETDMEVARLEGAVAVIDYQQQLERVAAEALTAYWQLQRASSVLVVLGRSRDTAQSLLRDVESRVEVGRVAPIGAVEARGAVMLRQAEISRAEQALRDSEARIKALLRATGEERRPGALRIIALTRPGQFDHRPDMSLSAIERAVERWPAVRIATLRRDQNLVRLNFADNQRRPTLDFQASYSTSGMAYDFNRSWEFARTTRYPDWFVGLNFELPLAGNRRAGAQYEAQALRLRQSEEELNGVKAGIAIDLRSRLEQLIAAREEIGRFSAEVELRAQLLDLERRQLSLGISRVGQVLQRESDFVESSLRMIESETRAALLLTGIMLAEGSLLPVHSIEVEQ